MIQLLELLFLELDQLHAGIALEPRGGRDHVHGERTGRTQRLGLWILAWRTPASPGASTTWMHHPASATSPRANLKMPLTVTSLASWRGSAVEVRRLLALGLHVRHGQSSSCVFERVGSGWGH